MALLLQFESDAASANRLTGDGFRETPTRERILRVATALFRQRGYHSVGLTEILTAARAPKGSLYHHFPQGKAELAENCIARVADASIAALDLAEADGRTISDQLRRSAMQSARWLQLNQWRDGSLLAVIGQEEAGQEGSMGDAVRLAYQRIEMRLAKMLMREGMALSRAREIAATIIAAEEGALVLARSRRDGAPLHHVANMLVGLVAEGATSSAG
ncbi:MAG: helix-turn-helix domain-containing protein [Blastomonas sp.]